MSWQFEGSPAHTLGVELELGVVNVDSCELQGAAPQIVAAVDPRRAGEEPAQVKNELFESTLEIVTGICRTPAEAREDLSATLTGLGRTLDAQNVALMAAGTHPFSHWQQQTVTRDDRYLELIERFLWPVRQLTTYGLHIHVGVPSGEHAIAAINAVTGLLPHFLALSASSPYWQGADTGLASARSRLWESVPSSGLPPRLRSWSDFQWLAEVLVGAGTIRTSRDLWWDIRPSPMLGTVELRICDSVPRLTEASALAALAQAVVAHACERLDAGDPLPRDPDWLVKENKWRASRHGIDATMVHTDGSVTPLVDEIQEWVARVRPSARRLGAEAELEEVLAIVRDRPSYARQRDLVAEGGSLHDVVNMLRAELAPTRIGG